MYAIFPKLISLRSVIQCALSLQISFCLHCNGLPKWQACVKAAHVLLDLGSLQDVWLGHNDWQTRSSKFHLLYLDWGHPRNHHIHAWSPFILISLVWVICFSFYAHESPVFLYSKKIFFGSVNFTQLRRGQCQNSYMHTPIEMIFIVKSTKWKKLMEKCPCSFVRC